MHMFMILTLASKTQGILRHHYLKIWLESKRVRSHFAPPGLWYWTRSGWHLLHVMTAIIWVCGQAVWTNVWC